MKEIIFWFSSNKIKKYWFNYALNDLKRHTVPTKTNKLESWIQFLNLKIYFKVNNRENLDLIGLWNKNQYWVEDLFDNNFEEFFYTFIFENKPFEGE